MARDLWSGLVVAGDVLEWTTLQRTKDGLRVRASRRTELPAAASEADAGAADPRGAALKAECAGLKRPVSLGLPADQVLLRVVQLPTADDAELRDMVQLQADKYSPFPLEGLVISHEVLARRPEGSRVLIGAVREAVVEEQAQGLRAAGVTPARVDVALLGWWRLLADAGQIQERGRQLVLLLHGGTPELIVWQDGEPRLFRTLNGLDGLSEEELAAELSREIGYTLMSVELDQGPAPAAAVAVRHAAGGRFEGVAARLRAGPWGEASVQSLEGLPTASEGLARRLEAGPGLDLTPESWRAAARQRQFRRRMLAGAAAGLGLWALLVSLFYGGLAYERLRLKRLEADYAAVRDPAMEVREMRRRVGLIRRYMDRSSSVLECLREVSLAMPPGLELLSFSYRKGEDVKIRGVGQAVDQVYVFKSGLDESAVFRATTLKGVQERGGKQFFDMDLGLGGGAE